MRGPNLAALAVLSVLAAGCGGGAPAREDVLADLADDVIVPAYGELVAEASGLVDATRGLCSTLAADDLASTREALAAARGAWSYSEAMWVGPVMERRSWAVIDWPIAPDEIEALIADDGIELANERLARRIGADQRGLSAVEYILGSAGNAEAVLDLLADDRRCQYLTGIAVVIADEASLLPTDWTVDFEANGPYRDTFADPAGTGLDALVNDALFLLEAMADGELGTALGEMEREADLDAISEGPEGLAVADLASHLDGLRIVLSGRDTTPGLRPLLGDDLADRLREQLDVAHYAVTAIDPPLRAAVIDAPESVSAARDAIKAVQVTVATEVVSRLGVTIGFSDADGDTGS